MKKLFVLLMAASLLTGLYGYGGTGKAPETIVTPDESAVVFTREEVADLVQFSKTTNAYYNLMQGSADLLIVGEPGEEVLQEKERTGFHWEQAPFATDAFVFVVNETNPVDSITVDEARRIYTGEITNWSKLGGEDQEIIPADAEENAPNRVLFQWLLGDEGQRLVAHEGYISIREAEA